jgi:hypothetical protein
MIDVNNTDDTQRTEYIFGDHVGPVTNRFGWLEGALLGDIQTFVNTLQTASHLVQGGGNLSIPTPR